MNTIAWLLNSDPAIRWQTLRDLTDASAEEIAAERKRISQVGLAAKILSCQESDGSWRRADCPTWATTLFTLQLLRATGVDPADPEVVKALGRSESNLKWNDNGGWNLRPAETGGNPFFEGEEEPCINGGVLAFGSYFGHPAERLANRLASEQLEDGGWNCEAPKSVRSSFHSTICVLEGLLEYERAAGTASEVSEARSKGEEYLLARGLFRRHSTGEIIDPRFLDSAFPPRYHYDVLRALDYFRVTGAEPDARMGDAVELIESRRQTDGRWVLDRAFDETLAVSTDESVGQPSRWNTLRALRVLRWYRQCGLLAQPME